MSPVDLLGSQAGRVLRVVAGTGLLVGGLRRGDAKGKGLAALGVVPLAAGLGDVCVLGPLVGESLNGKAFRTARSATPSSPQT